MVTTPMIENVIYDPAKRSFLGRVMIARGLKFRVLDVAAPGHPTWEYPRIVKSLAQAAEITLNRMEPKNVGA